MLFRSLQEPDGAVTKYQRARVAGKLTAFELKLLLALEADAHQPKRDRRTALMLLSAMQKEGFTGGYSNKYTRNCAYIYCRS